MSPKSSCSSDALSSVFSFALWEFAFCPLLLLFFAIHHHKYSFLVEIIPHFLCAYLVPLCILSLSSLTTTASFLVGCSLLLLPATEGMEPGFTLADDHARL